MSDYKPWKLQIKKKNFLLNYPQKKAVNHINFVTIKQIMTWKQEVLRLSHLLKWHYTKKREKETL